MITKSIIGLWSCLACAGRSHRDRSHAHVELGDGKQIASLADVELVPSEDACRLKPIALLLQSSNPVPAWQLVGQAPCDKTRACVRSLASKKAIRRISSTPSMDAFYKNFTKAAAKTEPWSRWGSMTPSGVTAMSMVINVLLSAIKVGVGTIASSTSLVADGWHSLSDLCSDTMCMVSLRIPRFQHQCTLGIAIIIMTAGTTMIWQNGYAILNMLLCCGLRRSQSTYIAVDMAGKKLAAIVVALMSVASKDFLFFVTRAVGNRLKNPAMLANAAHHRTDALSSKVAIVGIMGSILGWNWLDPTAALYVGCMVTGLAVEVGKDSLPYLFGKGAEEVDDTPITPRCCS